MFQIDAKKLKYFDYPLFFAVLAINIIGIFTIWTTQTHLNFALKQMIWVVTGSILAIVVSSADTKRIKSITVYLYIFSIILLAAVFANGILSHGAKRWISLYFFHMQPSEFIKVAIILMLAYYFDENPKSAPYTLKELSIPVFIALIPTVFILKQPDLGTAFIILFITLSIILIAGVKRSLIIKFIMLSFALAPFVWSNLRGYQKDRILAFINPNAAPTTFGYHTLQSEVAIGSGGMYGKGIEGATQTLLNFLPEHHTDFIFAVFSEQWGFAGDLALIFLYTFIILRGLQIAKLADGNFERFVALGIVVMLWISFLLNVGMTIGLIPVVGVPLLFFSYGGSAVIASFFALGILLSIRMRSFM